MACVYFNCMNCGNLARFPDGCKPVDKVLPGEPNKKVRSRIYECPQCGSHDILVEWEEQNDHKED